MKYDYLKDIQVGDIWLDRYGDRVLIQEICKPKSKNFFVFLDVILLTNVQNSSTVRAGEYIAEYDPLLLRERIA